MRTTRWIAVALALAMLAVPAAADELQDAMDRADALNLFRQLNVQPGQARQMVAPLERIRDLVASHESEREAALDRLESTLEEARERLVEGEALSNETIAALQRHEEQSEAAELALRRAVDSEMQAIAGVLDRTQNQFLSWTAPASIRPEAHVEERLRMQQVAMGRVQEAVRMLEAVKYLHAFNFVTGRMPLVNDYLVRYFQPDAQQFQQAFQIVIAYTDEVRLLPQQQWQVQAVEIAAAMVEDLGLMPTMDPGQRLGTVSWEALFGLVTNPQTVDVVRDLAQ